MRGQVDQLQQSIRSLGEVVAAAPAPASFPSLAQSLNAANKEAASVPHGAPTQGQLEALRARTEEVATELQHGLARLRGEVCLTPRPEPSQP